MTVYLTQTALDAVSSEGIAKGFQACRALERVELFHCRPTFLAAALPAGLQSVPHLELLQIIANSELDDDGAWITALPATTRLAITNCRQGFATQVAQLAQKANVKKLGINSLEDLKASSTGPSAVEELHIQDYTLIDYDTCGATCIRGWIDTLQKLPLDMDFLTSDLADLSDFLRDSHVLRSLSVKMEHVQASTTNMRRRTRLVALMRKPPCSISNKVWRSLAACKRFFSRRTMDTCTMPPVSWPPVERK